MRVAIITHWWCFENYGQLLQGYALQKYLEQRGHFGFIIKYFLESAFTDKLTFNRIVAKLTSWDGFKQGLAAARRRFREARNHRGARIKVLRSFDKFRVENMNYTKKVYRAYKELVKSDEISADVYLVGSDVVWKFLPFNDDGRAMFLDFGNTNATRISYSASFGDAMVSQEYIDYASPLIRKLDAVSVREPTGVEICNKLGRPDAVCVMDPVFLLSAEYYRKQFEVPGQRKGVCGYFLRMKPSIPLGEMMKMAKALNQEAPQFITVYDDMNLPKSLLINPTLPEWIRIIGSARLLVTNSFHGVSMAIILHTPFVVMLKDHGEGMDNRLLGLLDQLNLQDRIYDGNTKTFAAIVNKPIEWAVVDDALSDQLRLSLGFLESNGI